MKLEKVLIRMRQARTDGEELRRLARDVGRELPRRRLEVLRELRAGLGASAEQVTDPFAQGYRAALDDLMAAYEAALEPAQDARFAARCVKLRPQLQQVLHVFRAGSQRPTDVSRRLRDTDMSLVSRWLAELRNLGLVEVYAQDAVSAREKPHRLTEQGRQVLELQRRGPSEESSALLRLAAQLFSWLAQEGRVLRSAFQQRVEQELERLELDPHVVCEAIIQEVRHKGLLEDVNEVLVERFLTAADIVQNELERALAEGLSGLPPSLELLRRELPARSTPVIVASKGRDTWNRFVVEYRDVLSSHEALSNLQVVTWADLHGAIHLPRLERCSLVFESESLAEGPSRQLAESKLGGGSAARFVFSTGDALRVPDVKPLVVGTGRSAHGRD